MKTAFALLTALLMQGCATVPGVKMSDAERQACAEQTCTVWTAGELRLLIIAAYRKGMESAKGSI